MSIETEVEQLITEFMDSPDPMKRAGARLLATGILEKSADWFEAEMHSEYCSLKNHELIKVYLRVIMTMMGIAVGAPGIAKELQPFLFAELTMIMREASFDTLKPLIFSSSVDKTTSLWHSDPNDEQKEQAADGQP